MLKVAIIGYGWWGRHMAARLADHPLLRVVLIVEPHAALREEIQAAGFAAAPDLEAALAVTDIDALILTTPSALHADQVVASAAAGKHVFCEKPLALSGEDARRAVKACGQAGLVLGIGHERRFEPAMQRVRSLVEAGDLGTILHAEAAFSHDKLASVPPGDWRTTKRDSPAAGMTAMGIHLTDLYIGLFGPVSTVQALVGDRVLGWETGDGITVQLQFEAGMTATLSALLATPVFLRFHVFGSRRWVEVRNSDHPESPTSIAELAISESGVPTTSESYERTDTVLQNLEAFAAAVAGETPYPISTDQMVHNIDLLQAIAQSAETGETIRLSPGIG